jgi:hypothetical protein
VRVHQVGGVFSLLRQGLTLGVQFGTHSVEALLWVAQTLEEAVYQPGSLTHSAEGISFVLDNPLLRVGAFTSVRILVDGVEVPAERVHLRPGPGTPWRTAAAVGPDSPFALAPGDGSEFAVAGNFPTGPDGMTVRIELHEPAIPPRVWFQFWEIPSEATHPP